MAEYLLQDKDKAAFINRMNKVLSQIGSGFGLDQNSFVDVPETEDDDKCIYIASTDVEEKVVDSMIDKNVFSYKVKKISVNEILREIKCETYSKQEVIDYIKTHPNSKYYRIGVNQDVSRTITTGFNDAIEVVKKSPISQFELDTYGQVIHFSAPSDIEHEKAVRGMMSSNPNKDK